MADVVAQPAAQAAQPVYIWAGGIFDTMIVGFPLYFWIIFLGAIALIGILIFDWYRWDVIKAVSGHFDAARNATPEALKITKNMRMKLVPAVYADQIFEWEDPKEIEKWHLTAPHSVGQLGPVNTAILIDYHDWVDNPVYNESIKIAATIWNEKHPDDQIHHFSKYMAYRQNGKLKECTTEDNIQWNASHPDDKIPIGSIRIPAYFWVDWASQEQYMPNQRDAASFGGYLRREAAKLKTGDNDEKKNYGTWILGGCVIVGICILIFSWITWKGM